MYNEIIILKHQILTQGPKIWHIDSISNIFLGYMYNFTNILVVKLVEGSFQSPATFDMSCRTSTFQFAVVSCRARHEGTRHIFRHLFLPLCCNILPF